MQSIHRQLKLAESLMGEDKQTQTEFDSEQVLSDLKQLYNHFHIPFSEDDEFRVL